MVIFYKIRKIFLKTLPSSYANLSHWLLKTPISKGKWYGRFYNAFCKNCFNKLQSITLRRVLANPQQCATEKIFRIYLKYINSKNTECFLHNSALCILNSALKRNLISGFFHNYPLTTINYQLKKVSYDTFLFIDFSY